MNIKDILLVYEYNYWANKRILAASAPPLSLGGTSPPNPQEKVEIIMSDPYCVFGGESIESPDGESLEGVVTPTNTP
jgi:hypothetical protein